MALPKTPKQCEIRIGSLKRQVAIMEKRKKTLSAVVKKKPVKKVVARKPVKKVVRKPAKKPVRKAAPRKKR